MLSDGKLYSYLSIKEDYAFRACLSAGAQMTYAVGTIGSPAYSDAFKVSVLKYPAELFYAGTGSSTLKLLAGCVNEQTKIASFEFGAFTTIDSSFNVSNVELFADNSKTPNTDVELINNGNTYTIKKFTSVTNSDYYTTQHQFTLLVTFTDG